MTPVQYRKKPVVIEAAQLTAKPDGTNADDWAEIATWCGAEHYADHLMIRTLEGSMCANVGDYVIKGVKGEFYPCKPEIFAATYDLATESR